MSWRDSLPCVGCARHGKLIAGQLESTMDKNMEQSTVAQLAELRKQHEELGERIAQLESGQAKPVAAAPSQGQRVVERQVSITTSCMRLDADPRMPSPDEMNELIKIVLDRYPRFAPNNARFEDHAGRLGAFNPDAWDPIDNRDHREYFTLTQLAFRWQLSTLRGDIDLYRTVGFWVSNCDNWLYSNSRREQMGNAPLMVAVIAAGDIGFVDIDTFYPHRMHFGLVASGEHGRVAQASTWRSVLQQRKVAEPSNVRPVPREAGRVSINLLHPALRQNL